MPKGVNERVSPGRVVLILTMLLAVWLGFQFFPRRREPPPTLAPVKAETRLRAAGLADNPDWAGLPELFAVWADKVEWEGNTVHFAYWHPGARAYAYFFEAIRRDGRYRFQVVSPQRLAEEGYQAENGDDPAQLARRETEASTHPFVFLHRVRLESLRASPVIIAPLPEPAKSSIPVELKPSPLVETPSATANPR